MTSKKQRQHKAVLADEMAFTDQILDVKRDVDKEIRPKIYWKT